METAAAIITSLSDDTTQEYKQEEPLETLTPVDGGEVGVAVNLNEGDTDVDATMAKSIPKFVMIQRKLGFRYLHMDRENASIPDALRCLPHYSYGLQTRFEVVQATTGTGLVHIRCLHNNKYWAHAGTRYSWITAMAVKPEENQSNRYCTLFQPIFTNDIANNNTYWRLRHVNTGKLVAWYPGTGDFSDSLCLLDDHPLSCDFINWESVVVLPDLIRIKNVDNGNHLKASDEDGYMDFLCKADNSSLYDYEVSPSHSGGCRLKSVAFDKYWWDSVSSPWVVLQTPSPLPIHLSRSVFIPTVLGLNRTVLRCFETNLYCKRYSENCRVSLLATRDSHPDAFSYMEIETPVILRMINNVRYRLTDAHIYGVKDLILITKEFTNRTLEPITVPAVDLRYSDSWTSTWTTSVALTFRIRGFLTSMGIPRLDSSGSIELSGGFSDMYQWGETVKRKTEEVSLHPVIVPPMSRVMVSLMSTHGSYDIPFSYTQRDFWADGTVKLYVDKDDGLMTGRNGYNYMIHSVQSDL